MLLILEPNWQKGLTTTYQFKTDITTSRNGTETRRALINDPRMTVKFSTWRNGEEVGCLQAQLDSGVTDEFYIPDPARNAEFDADLTAGIDQVLLLTMPAWVVEGAKVLLVGSDGAVEPRTVESVTGLTVDFVEIGGVDFLAGTEMRGAFPVVAKKGFSASWLTSGVMEADIDARILPGHDMLYDAPAWGEQLNTFPVFNVLPNWIGPSKIKISTNADVNDFDRGVVSIRDYKGFPTQVTSWVYTGLNITDVQTVVDFFRLMKGMRGTFHAPSWVADMQPVTGLVSGGTQLVVTGRCPYDTYNGRPYNGGVTITLCDGTLIHREVSSITPFDNAVGWDYDWGNNYGGLDTDRSTLITIDGTWPSDVDLTDICKVSWLRKSRFAKDLLTVKYITSTVADIMVSIQTLRDGT